MNYFRRFIFAIIVLLLLYSAWYGAEMLIHGESQRSAVDIAIAIMISLSISGSIEKGVEKSERKREVAEKVSKEFLEYIEKGKKAPNRDVRDGKQD